MVSGRSREGAWIEIVLGSNSAKKQAGRSREGAWIEIRFRRALWRLLRVAPARERGLK